MNYPPPRGFFEMLSRPLGGVRARLVASLLSPTERKVANALAAPMQLFRPGEVLALMPYAFVP